jgi:hypothetical protein
MNTITIDGVEHNIDTMTDEQKVMVKHIADIDNKINIATFSLTQMQVAKHAFVTMLKGSLGGQQ